MVKPINEVVYTLLMKEIALIFANRSLPVQTTLILLKGAGMRELNFVLNSEK